jgi:hypothetical protein
MTHALPNSTALDAGDNCVTDVAHCGDANITQLTSDQRGAGFSRQVDGPDGDATATVDIGAYEMQTPLANLADTGTNEDTQVLVPFDAGDTSTITSVTADSSNTTLVPHDSAHLSVAITGSTGVVTINPATNEIGTTNITVTVNRSVGGPDIKTFMLTVTAVNDAPSFTKGADQTVNEDSGAQTVTPWATSISAGPTDESGQTVSFTVTNNNNALFSSQPAVNSAGTLSYTPAANANGSATVTVTAVDNGGGGNDTSPPQTFTITVSAINDPPSFTKGANQTVNEDAGAQTVTPWATGISAGPNESGQTVTFTVTNNNNALFSSQPALNSAGTLTYTPAADANGSATVTVTAVDNGGTGSGGNDTSPSQTLTITVSAVNDPPSFTKGADQTVNEDAGAQTVTNWATSISPGPNESGQTVTFTVTNNNNALFSSQPAVSSAGTLNYTPAANANGSATVTVTAKDNGGGGNDTSPAQTFTITVSAINDPPSFTKGANQTVNEDSGAQTVTPWATAISAGPNETGQTVTFTVTNNNNGLFSSQPALSAAGTLTYTPAADANGSATVTVTAKDDGGTGSGGNDTSPSQTFTITVTAVNDAPSFTKGADQTVNNNAGAQSVVGWATNISAGPANESGQTVTFTVTNNNNALFSSQPAISSSGTLTYTPSSSGGGVDDHRRSKGQRHRQWRKRYVKPQTFTSTATPVGVVVNFTEYGKHHENSGFATVNVVRSGNTSSAATVNYATNADAGVPGSTANGVAFQCDSRPRWAL